MATLTTVLVDEDGANPGLVAAAVGGDEFANNGHCLLIVNNGGGSQITVTVTAQTTSEVDPALGKLTKADRQVAVPAAGMRVIGPFKPQAYNDANGRVQVTYSGVTSVTVGVVRTQ